MLGYGLWNVENIWERRVCVRITLNDFTKKKMMPCKYTNPHYKDMTVQVQIEKKGKKNKSREEIFYQMKVFFVMISCKFV